MLAAKFVDDRPAFLSKLAPVFCLITCLARCYSQHRQFICIGGHYWTADCCV